MKKKLAMFGLMAILALSITSLASASFDTTACGNGPEKCWMDK